MVEELKEDEKKEEPASKDAGEGIQSETTSELDRADQIAERQKRENDRREKLLEREEALEARRAVGGRAEAGKETAKPEYSEEEKASRARIKAVGDASGAGWAKDYE